jgi:hypothetical protein
MSVQQLDRLGVVSVAKMYAAVTAVISLLYAIPILMFGSVMDAGFGVGMFLVIIVAAAIGGFVSGAIGAFVYNVVAGAVGGVELYLSDADGHERGATTGTQRTDANLD